MEVAKQVSRLGKKAGQRREPHVVFGQTAVLWGSPETLEDQKGEEGWRKTKTLCSKTASPRAAHEDRWAPRSRGGPQGPWVVKPVRPGAPPPTRSAPHSCCKSHPKQTRSPHSRLNRTKPTPRNKLDRRAHHVTQLTVLKSRIPNIITNDIINWRIGLKPKANNSLL